MTIPSYGQVQGRFPVLERLGDFLPKKTVPFIAQTTATDCAAAALAMVLAYHGREVRLDEIRDLVAPGRDGASALAIIDAATPHGLRGRGLRLELDDLRLLEGPAILHWNLRHFVVFERTSDAGVEIVDPAHGPRTVPWKEVDRAFTGIAIAFEKTERFAEAKGKGEIMRALRSAVLSMPSFRRMVAISVLLQLLAITIPLFTGRIVDRVLPRSDLHLMAVLCVGAGLAVIFSGVAAFARTQLLSELRTRLDVRLTLGFLDHLVKLPYAFFQTRPVGDLMTRLSGTNVIREILTTSILSGFVDTSLVAIYLVLLVVMSPKLAAVAVGLVLVQTLFFLCLRKKQLDLAAGSLAKQAEQETWLVDMLGGIETLKAAGYEHRASQHWASLYVDYMNIAIRRTRLTGIMDSVMSTLRMATPFILLLIGSIDVMANTMSLGDMLSANAFASGFIAPVTGLVSMLSQLQIVRSYLGRIEDVLVAPPEQEIGRGRAPGVLGGRVTLDRVGFKYGPRTPPVVREATLDAQPGEMIAIVGRSGCGKSTLAGLLVGLHRPQAGTVLYDGRPLADLDLGAVRRQIGVVVQKPHVFGASIRANIAMFDPDVSEAQIEQAARVACIHDEIMKMPLGYETPLVGGGGSLSGGQRQRIALARALVRNPRVVVLDEATSALDNVTEQQVMKNLRALGVTLIVIAHRMSVVKDASYILVMEGGTFVEGGTHEQLLAMRGPYSMLATGAVPAVSGTVPKARGALIPLDSRRAAQGGQR
ncbi:MAG: peptidase domain-containing ABC transporter [Labilithrix sp.]|nr:peptidase domain-containing ABC transporter [Labilithrix sp.]